MDTATQVKAYRDCIANLVGLPTLPTIAMEIQQIMRDDQLSVAQTVPILEQDPSLAMKILKVANSAFYGMDRPIESLRQAVVILGMRELAGIALGFSVLKALSQGSNDQVINWKRFWEHSIAVAHLTELLDDELGIHSEHSPYSLGLLHDIGKLVLHRLDGALYEETRLLAHSETLQGYDAERRMFGLTHMEAGRIIAEKWGLSTAIQETIQQHHDPESIETEDVRIVAAMVNLADYIANLNGMNFELKQLRVDDWVPAGWKVLQQVSFQAKNHSFDEFLLDMDEHWSAIREMVRLLEM